jgi:hypothetical protein
VQICILQTVIVNVVFGKHQNSFLTETIKMVRKPIMQQIAELEERKKSLIARLGKQERARDTRRKILLGALVLHRLDHANDPEFTKRLRDWLRRELPGFLTRDNDKALFADLLNATDQISAGITADGTRSDWNDSGEHG